MNLKVTPPMYVPSKSDVRNTFAAGSVANEGNSCMYVATHVRTAAKPTKLQIENTFHKTKNTKNKME